MSRRTKALLIAGGAFLCVVGVLGAIKAAQIGRMQDAQASFQPPPEAVTTGKVEEVEWQTMLTAVGTLVATRGVTIASEVPGTVVHIGFESGQRVERGALLLQLDISADRAALRAAEARAGLARINRDRHRALRKLNANTEADLDAAQAQAEEADANVADMRAAINKKRIRAPFDGRLGIRAVDLGQVLAPGTPIVELTSFDPIFADFSLPQQALGRLALEQAVFLSTDAFPDTWEGKITALATEVDPGTRNIEVRARFPNPGEQLRPGMFVNVEVHLPEVRRLLVVSATAVKHAPYGDSVFTVEEDRKAGQSTALDTKRNDGVQIARQRSVRTGERRGDLVAIESGLKEGEIVVTSGAFKLKSGTPVIVDNALAPEAKVSPTPEDR